MTDSPWDIALINLWISAVVVVLVFAGALLVAVRRGWHDGIDVVWGTGFVGAVVAVILAAGHGEPHVAATLSAVHALVRVPRGRVSSAAVVTVARVPKPEAVRALDRVQLGAG